MAERRLADAFAGAFAALDARLEGIAGHEAAARDNSLRQWDALHSVGAQLDQLRSGTVETNRGLTTLAAELEDQRAQTGRQWDLIGQVNLTLRSVADNMAKAHALERERLARHAAELPIFHTFAQNAIAPTTGPVVINCGGPAVGREWHVKRLVVGGVTLATAAAGSAEVYVSAFVPDAATTGSSPTTPTSLSDLVDATILIGGSFANLPNIANYDDGQVYLHGREKLWVVIRSATAGQQYVVGGTAKDLRVAPHDVSESVG